MSKKTLALAFFLAFVNAFSAEVWDGSVATSFAGGDGSKENPYQIATGAQLAYFHSYVETGKETKGKYFALVNDITLNTDTINYPNEFCPIGSGGACSSTNGMNVLFKGVFNGNKHTIIGLRRIYRTFRTAGFCGCKGFNSFIGL